MTFAGYEGQRVVVTGASSGVGLATATALVDMGAHVIGMSRRAPALTRAEFHALDLAEPGSIRAAATAIGTGVDALFNCAGAPPMLPSAELVTTNFLGTRLLTELISASMPPGSAIVTVASTSGAGWRGNLPNLLPFLEIASFEEADAWYRDHEAAAGHGYPFSKQAIIVWTLQRSAELITRGIRINAVSPGAIQTPLLEASAKVFPPEYMALTEFPIGRSSSVEEQVGAVLFLNSPAASYINGVDLPTDGGHTAVQTLAGELG